jgi:hypothetical protein
MAHRNPLQNLRFWRHESQSHPAENRPTAQRTPAPVPLSSASNQWHQGHQTSSTADEASVPPYPPDSYQEFERHPFNHERNRVGGVCGYGESDGPHLVGSGMLLGQEAGWYDDRSDWLTYSEPVATGQFRGIGPKDYERSGERLREVICERLTDDATLDPRDISVQVDGTTVTLEGTVPQRSMKYRAEDLVAQCGVDDINNHLRVRKGT